MDSLDAIQPFTAYLSTNCQVCLYLVDYVAEHAQKHESKSIKQQVLFDSMSRCRLCFNKMPFDRIAAHIKRKHGLELNTNTKYRKINRKSNQPSHDWDLSSTQLFHSAVQFDPCIACQTLTRAIQSLDSSAEQVNKDTQNDSEEQSNVDVAEHYKSILVKPIVICPGTQSEDDSENDEVSPVIANNGDSSLLNDAVNKLVEQTQPDCQQETTLTKDPLAFLREPSRINFSFITEFTANHQTDSSISVDVIDLPPKQALDYTVSAQQDCFTSQNEEPLAENPIDQNAKCENDALIKRKSEIVELKLPNEQIKHANSAKKRTFSNPLEDDSLIGQDTKKCRNSDVNQNQFSPLNEEVNVPPQNENVVLEENEETDSTDRNVQRPLRSEHDSGSETAISPIETEIVKHQSIDVVEEISSMPTNASNGALVPHSSLPSRNNFHSVYMSENVLNLFMEFGCIQVQNGRLFVQES